jgi:exonuclease III
MCNKAGQTDQRFIRETFETNPYCSYNFYHQSVSNKRGVGILVKKTLNFVCLDTERDQISDNYLLIRAQVNGTTVILGSIYGPNTRDDDFFDRLQAGLNRFSGDPVILGGDFNCTVSCLPVRENPDVMNMAELPNLPTPGNYTKSVIVSILPTLLERFFPKELIFRMRLGVI